MYNLCPILPDSRVWLVVHLNWQQ